MILGLLLLFARDSCCSVVPSFGWLRLSRPVFCNLRCSLKHAEPRLCSSGFIIHFVHRIRRRSLIFFFYLSFYSHLRKRTCFYHGRQEHFKPLFWNLSLLSSLNAISRRNRLFFYVCFTCIFAKPFIVLIVWDRWYENVVIFSCRPKRLVKQSHFIIYVIGLKKEKKNNTLSFLFQIRVILAVMNILNIVSWVIIFHCFLLFHSS